MSSINTFRYDPRNKIIDGYYNDDLQIESLDDIVSKVLYEESAGVVRDLMVDGMNVAAKPDLTVEDGIGFFSRLMSGVSSVSEQQRSREYEKRSRPWIDAIKKETVLCVKRDLVSKYIAVISKYIRTNLQYLPGKSTVPDTYTKGVECSVCCRLVSDELEEYCEWCGGFVQQFVLTSKYVDSIEVDNKPNKVVKDLFDKFREHYLRYQGRSHNTVAKEDVEKIKQILQRDFTIITTEEFRIDNNRLLRRELTKIKLGKYKDDANLLMNEIWNYPLPNYKEYDELIEYNWRIGQAVFDANKAENDPQTLAYNDWRLYQELTDVGIELDETNFQISTNKQMKKRHDELWSLRCIAVAEAAKNKKSPEH